MKKFAPKGTCWERDFYEYELNGKKTNNKYEGWLARIENDAVEKLRLVVDRTRFGQWDATVWAGYVASLFVRTEKYRAQMSAAMTEKFRLQTEKPDYIRDMQYELLKRGDLVFAEDLKKKIESLRSSMESNPSFYHLSGIEHNVVTLGAAIMGKTWHTIQAAPGTFFLTSDCPVTTVELVDGQVRPGAGLGREHTAIILAVTPEYLFVASPQTVHWRAVAEPRLVDSVNLLAVQFAHKRVYSHVNSQRAKTLVDAQLNQVKFGVNAFLPSSSSKN